MFSKHGDSGVASFLLPLLFVYEGGVGVKFWFSGIVICVCISLAINSVRAGCFAYGILSLMCLCFCMI